MTHAELTDALKRCKRVVVFVAATGGYAVQFQATKNDVHNLLITHTGDGMRFNAKYAPADFDGGTLYIGK
jgi:hypothetical protein